MDAQMFRDFATTSLTPKNHSISVTPDSSKRFPNGMQLYDEEEVVEHVDILVNYTQSVSMRQRKCLTSSPVQISRPGTERSFCFSPVVDMVELKTLRRCIISPRVDGTPKRGRFASPAIFTQRSSLTLAVPRRSAAEPDLIKVLRDFQKQHYQKELDWSKAVKRTPESSSGSSSTFDSKVLENESFTPLSSCTPNFSPHLVVDEDFFYLAGKHDTLRTASASVGGDLLLSPSTIE